MLFFLPLLFLLLFFLLADPLNHDAEKRRSDALPGRCARAGRPRGLGGGAPALALLLGVRGPGRGPWDEHAGALAAALQLLPRRPGAVVPAVAGAVVVVVQRVGRWRQQRRLRRHMGARREPLQIFFLF